MSVPCRTPIVNVYLDNDKIKEIGDMEYSMFRENKTPSIRTGCYDTARRVEKKTGETPSEFDRTITVNCPGLSGEKCEHTEVCPALKIYDEITRAAREG